MEDMSARGETGHRCLADRIRPVELGLVGLGRWGRNYVRVAEAAGARITVCHTRSRSSEVQRLLAEHPGTVHVQDLDALLGHDVAAIVVAGPRDTHAAITGKVLEGATPVLVEKPTAVGRPAVEKLHRTAEGAGVLLRTGYTLLYDDAFLEFRRIGARRGADSWDWLWHKGLPGYGCVEIVWEFFPHVFAILLALHGGGIDAAVDGAEVVARPGPDRTGTVRLTLPDLPAGPTSVEVSTVAGRERRKVIRGLRGRVVVAGWSDRAAWDPLDGRTFRDDEEPLVRQLSGFLRDTATPEDVRAAERQLDVTVAGALERLARAVIAQT